MCIPLQLHRQISPTALVLLSFALLTSCTGCGDGGSDGGSATPDDPAAVQGLSAAETTTDKGGNIIEVSFREKECTDDMLKHIAGLKKVRTVLLNDTAITDAGLAHLAEVKTLTSLDLRGCAVTDEGLKHLSGLSNLRALRLNAAATGVSDAGMEAIAGLTKMKALALDLSGSVPRGSASSPGSRIWKNSTCRNLWLMTSR